MPDGSGGSTFYLPGETYGPYLENDRWRLRLSDDDADPSTPDAPGADTVILDNNGYPILYYPARRSRPDVGVSYVAAIPGASANPAPLFNSQDNALFPVSQADAVSANHLPAGLTAATDDAKLELVGDALYLRELLGDVNKASPADVLTSGNGIIDEAEQAVERPYLLIATGSRVVSAEDLSPVNFGDADYDEYLKRMGFQYGLGAITNFDAERE